MLEITFRDHFFVHFSYKYFVRFSCTNSGTNSLYLGMVFLGMIEKVSTDVTNKWFQVTRWSFRVRDLVLGPWFSKFRYRPILDRKSLIGDPI